MDIPSPYPATGPAPTGRPRRSPILGVLSLVILVVALILISVVAYGLIAIASGASLFGLVEVYPLIIGPGSGSLIVGFIGAVIAVIAIATRRGRKFGVIALVLVPLGWIIAFVGFLGSYLMSG